MKKNYDLLALFVIPIIMSITVCFFIHTKNSIPIKVSEKKYSILEKYAIKNEYTLIEFMDYQCPPCRMSYPSLKKTILTSTTKINLSICHFPLSFHNRAMPCAYAVEYAKKYGKFNEMHDALMTSSNLNDDTINKLFQKLSIPNESDSWKKDPVAVKSLNSFKEVGKIIGIEGTPTMFLYTPQKEIYIIRNIDQIRLVVK